MKAGNALAPAPWPRAAKLLFVIVAGVLVLGDLGGLDLWAPDEPRYAQVAEELRRMDHGASDLVLLHLGGVAYTQKPPLYFWLAAGFGALAGEVDEWAARWPSALAALATLGLWIAIGRRLHPGTPIGWITGALLLTSFRFLHFARRAQLDVLLALFESLALWAFLDWNEATDARRRRRALWLLHGATALALLTKGPVGLLPWACFAAALAYAGRAREIPRLLPFWGVALSLGPVLVWIGACVALAPPGFFDAAVTHNLWTRFSEGTDHARPFWYFAAQLPVEALPWSLAWPFCAWRAWTGWRAGSRLEPNERDAGRLTRGVLVAWVVVPLIFFSSSAAKRGIYVLPVIPALCLWVAVHVDRLRRRTTPGRGLDGPGAAVLLFVGLALGAAVMGALVSEQGTPAPGGAQLPLAGLARLEVGAGALSATASATARAALSSAAAGLLCVAAAGMACVFWSFGPGRSRPPAPMEAASERPRSPSFAPRLRGGVIVWLGVVGVWAVWIFAVLPALEPEKSPRPLAQALARVTRPGEPVGLFRQATLQGGVLFYGDRPVRLLEAPASVTAFAAEGGRVVVVRRRDAPALAAIVPLRTIATLRSGERAQWIVEVGAEAAAAEPVQ